MTLCIAAIRDALDRSLAASPSVVILGEDLLDPYGGAFKATKGLSTKYVGRVLTTPISESAIVGIATGMALRGFRPVAEIMFGDFITLCADQIVNSAAKFPLMYKGKVDLPMVIRTPVAGARGYGPTHSQSLEKMFFGVPGLRVVAPNRLGDPGVVLETAILGGLVPTLFIEDKGDYAQHVGFEAYPRLFISSLEMTPFPTYVARNYASTKSPDVAILAYGGAASMVGMVLDELAEDEIYGVLLALTAVNDLVAIDTAIAALPRDVPVLIAEQGTQGFGWSSEIMARMLENGMTNRSVRRLAAKADVIPAARQLEAACILNETSIRHAIFEVLS